MLSVTAAFSGSACHEVAPGPATPAADLVPGFCGRLPGRQAERFGMSAAVVPSQDLGETAGPVREGAAADLAARDRQLGDGHREAARTWRAHRFYDASPVRVALPASCIAAWRVAHGGPARVLPHGSAEPAGVPFGRSRAGLDDQPAVLRSAVAPVSPGTDRGISSRSQLHERASERDHRAGEPIVGQRGLARSRGRDELARMLLRLRLRAVYYLNELADSAAGDRGRRAAGSGLRTGAGPGPPRHPVPCNSLASAAGR
jgi:hypothetical protein